MFYMSHKGVTTYNSIYNQMTESFTRNLIL